MCVCVCVFCGEGGGWGGGCKDSVSAHFVIQHIVVSMMTRLWARQSRILTLAGEGELSLLNNQISGAHPPSYSLVTGGSFLRVNLAKV